MVDRSNKSKRNRLKRNTFLSLLCYFTIIWCEYLMVLNMFHDSLGGGGGGGGGAYCQLDSWGAE